MPTIAQLIDELKAKGIKGYSGKSKAELEAMLGGKAVPAKAPKAAAGPMASAVRHLLGHDVVKTEDSALRALADLTYRKIKAFDSLDVEDDEDEMADDDVATGEVKNLQSKFPEEWSHIQPLMNKTIHFKDGQIAVKSDSDGSLVMKLPARYYKLLFNPGVSLRGRIFNWFNNAVTNHLTEGFRERMSVH